MIDEPEFNASLADPTRTGWTRTSPPSTSSPGRVFRPVSLGSIAGTSDPLVLSGADVAKIELLRDETPPPRACA